LKFEKKDFNKMKNLNEKNSKEREKMIVRPGIYSYAFLDAYWVVVPEERSFLYGIL
jgi:hypothetical protein